jgi:signal transduction histidine kinase/CheY-like chemotaxis protein
MRSRYRLAGGGVFPGEIIGRMVHWRIGCPGMAIRDSSSARLRWMRFSVSRGLQILAILLLFMFLGATGVELVTGRAAVMADTERQMARLDMVFAEQTGRAVETVDFILRSEIEYLQVLRARPPVDAASFRELLARRIVGVRQVSEIAVSDASGQILYSSRLGAPQPLATEAQVLIAARAADPHPRLQFSQPFRRPDGTWTALMVRPILALDGTYRGAALAFLNLAYFEDFYRAVEFNENGAILLHLRDGTVLARYPHNDAVIGQSYADLPPFKDVLAHGTAGTLVMDSPIDGRRRVMAIRALKAFPLAVNISVAQDRILESWRRQAWTFSVVAFAAALTVVGLLLLLAQRSRQVEEQMAERERAEAALRQAQRTEVLGQLTGGIAHDFNNLLVILKGNIELIRRTAELDAATGDRLKTMRAAVERGETLTGGLLAFAGRQPLSPQPVDLNAAIAGMGGLLDSAVGPYVRFEIRQAPDLCSAMVDPTQFELLVLNLVINARDAMPEGGTVTIATANVYRGPSRDEEEPVEGDYVVLTVRDTGVGMAPEVRAMAFEPFFTTKPPGTGSGLGLSQVFGTARQSGGGVQLDTVPGEGTAITVYLPRAPAGSAPARYGSAPAAQPEVGSAVILVVDDDPAVLGTMADILKNIGYSVVQATGGAAALDLLEREPVDLLLTDIVMAPISGPELVERVVELHPGLPILFISGYAGAAGLTGDLSKFGLIRKPFEASELRRQIEAALAVSRAPVSAS